MRKIAATYVFPLTQAPLKNGILICADDGTIVEIIDSGNEFREEAGVEFYSGILVPGFISLNCNLQNHDKVSNRKMWASGIALAADLKNSIYTVTEKNGCQFQVLNSSCTGLNKKLTIEASVGNGPFLEEIFLYQEKNKHIELSDVFKWGSLNNAKILGFEARFGSFDAGKTPGINIISGIDFQQMKLSPTSKVKRLV